MKQRLSSAHSRASGNPGLQLHRKDLGSPLSRGRAEADAHALYRTRRRIDARRAARWRSPPSRISSAARPSGSWSRPDRPAASTPLRGCSPVISAASFPAIQPSSCRTCRAPAGCAPPATSPRSRAPRRAHHRRGAGRHGQGAADRPDRRRLRFDQAALDRQPQQRGACLRGLAHVGHHHDQGGDAEGADRRRFHRRRLRARAATRSTTCSAPSSRSSPATRTGRASCSPCSARRCSAAAAGHGRRWSRSIRNGSGTRPSARWCSGRPSMPTCRTCRWRRTSRPATTTGRRSTSCSAIS